MKRSVRGPALMGDPGMFFNVGHRIRIFRPLATLLMLGLFSMPSIGQEYVQLVPRFQVGDVRYVELVQEIEQHSTGGRWGAEGRKTQSKRTRGMLQWVESVSLDKGTRLRFTYDRLQAEVDSRLGTVRFETDNDPGMHTSNPLAAIFRPLLGSFFVIHLSPEGRVLSCEGMESVLDKIEEAAAGSPLFNQMQDELTDDNARVVWGEHRMVLFPGKPVAEGDTWVRTVRTRGVYLGDLEREYRCTLQSVGIEGGRREARVGYVADVRRPPGANPGSRMSSTSLTLRSGRIEGTAVFDFERGEFTQQSDTMITHLEGSAAGAKPDEVLSAQTVTTTRQSWTVVSESQRQKQKEENRTQKPQPEHEE